MPAHRPLAVLALALAALGFGRLQPGAPPPQALATDATAAEQTTASLPLAAGSWQLAALSLPAQWQATTAARPAPAVVAVVDSGVSPDEPGLEGRVLPGYNLVAMNTDATDDNGHGTTIAEIIAAACDTCRILPVKVLGADHTGTWPTIEQGIRWAADHGAQVINLSLGSSHAPPDVGDAIAYAISKSVIVVAAAGNDGRNENFYPAMYPGVVSVAGVDENASRYSWSNYGSWVTVEAPGCAPAAGGAGDFCGTSAATPFIAGIAGLARSAHPSLAPGAFASELLATSPPPLDPSTAAAGLPNANRLLAAVAVSNAPPTATAAPTVTGSPKVGRRLSARRGGWSSATTYAVRWERSRDGRSWQAVGAGRSFVPGPKDVGYLLRVLVTATNANGSTSATSAVTARVSPKR
jgi:Subtilase family